MKHGLLLLIFLSSFSRAQETTKVTDYSVVLKPFSIDSLMGLHSYSFGQHDGKIVLIGGRLDGLHRRQPWASFDSIGHNDRILVVDPRTKQVWKAGLENLSPNLRDQLKATNTCFTQLGEQLVLIGGYGMSEKAGDHITFPYLTVIDLPQLIEAVQQKNVRENLFVLTEDTLFAVVGGQLQVLDDVFYLVGGHRFDGRYNPRNGPSYTQTYTSAARRFKLVKGKPEWLPPFESEELLHRRDMNTVLQQTVKGKLYLTTFSGVFREEADLPFQNAVHLDENGISEQPGFRQFYNHYHCPDVGIYDAAAEEMHTFFFGGIAQFYDSLGIPVQDDNVPFTRAISRVTRTAEGRMSEYRLSVEMPLLLGAGSEFIPARNTGLTERIFQLQQFSGDSVKLGYLFGGIASSEKNIFWINEGNESEAYSGLFEVILVKKPAAHFLNEMSATAMSITIEEHPTKDRYQLHYHLPINCKFVWISWISETGKTYLYKDSFVHSGNYKLRKKLPKKPGVYRIVAESDNGDIEHWEQYFRVE